MKLVRQELGEPDSYFFSDTIYAYKIMTFPGENKENWHLVFIRDEKLENVKEVKIHKKCCYKLPFKQPNSQMRSGERAKWALIPKGTPFRLRYAVPFRGSSR
jgi:hypothetical protein